MGLEETKEVTWLGILGDLEDGCAVSPARSWVTYGCSAGLPKPWPDLPGHVVRCSRWPSSGASQAIHSGGLHKVQKQNARICSGPFTETNDAVAPLLVPLKSPRRVEDPLCWAQAAQHCIREKYLFQVFNLGIFFCGLEQKLLFSDYSIPRNTAKELYLLLSVRSPGPSAASPPS